MRLTRFSFTALLIAAACVGCTEGETSEDAPGSDGKADLDIVAVSTPLDASRRQQACATVSEAHKFADAAEHQDFRSVCKDELEMLVVQQVFSKKLFIEEGGELKPLLLSEIVRILHHNDETYRVAFEQRIEAQTLFWHSHYIEISPASCEALGDAIADCVLDSGSVDFCIPSAADFDDGERVIGCCEDLDSCFSEAELAELLEE